MKNICLILITFICVTTLRSQTIPSSCLASDSVLKMYEKDAARLAVRHVHRMGTNYKDSVTIDRALKKRYRDALVAVHNATALPVRDTIVNIFKIHTNPNPELNEWQVAATPTLGWMQDLKNNNPPTTHTLISKLFPRYNLQYVYYQGSFNDHVTFLTDTNLNLKVLAKQLLDTPQVASSEPLEKFNDVRNITDSLHSNFIILRYSIGWGTCNDSCDFRTEWIVKVLNDCSVEYLGIAGDTLFTSLPENAGLLQKTILFPNPVKDRLIVANPELSGSFHMQLLDARGQVVKESTLVGKKTEIEMTDLTPGMYLIRLTAEGRTISRKILKD